MDHLQINDLQFRHNKNVLLGRNDYNWSKIPPATSRTRAYNLVWQVMQEYTNRRRLGSHGDFLLIGKLLNVFYVTSTKKITLLASKHGFKNLDCQYTQHTDIAELEACFGLLYLDGVFKSSYEDTRSLSATDGTGRDIFRATMSKGRFDDASTRYERKETDPLAGISQVSNKLVTNSQ
ncbi:hypothetical protein PR048_030823 [Dryococelus australis]|uniref:Uncharacterized protein n=1 Tax=Dryococelus australis TaxID=614101 RepID=A0ABQ9GDV7_9NEOP|nr:hypothetical protein PR048_030823 [Dryococelus australis]